MEEQLENIGCAKCPLMEKFLKRSGRYSDIDEKDFSAKGLKDLYGYNRGFSNPYIEINRQNFSSRGMDSSPSYKSNPMGYNLASGLTQGISYNGSGTGSGLSYESAKPGFHGDYE
jgi:hypothetical protein